jgi:hypothetical protein
MKPIYSKGGDSISYFNSEDRCLAVQIDPYLTIYYSIEDNKIVGVKINEVGGLKEED